MWLLCVAGRFHRIWGAATGLEMVCPWGHLKVEERAYAESAS